MINIVTVECRTISAYVVGYSWNGRKNCTKTTRGDLNMMKSHNVIKADTVETGKFCNTKKILQMPDCDFIFTSICSYHYIMFVCFLDYYRKSI